MADISDAFPRNFRCYLVPVLDEEASSDALSEIAQIARTAILRANALQRQLALEKARYAALQRRLDVLIGQVEESHARF